MNQEYENRNLFNNEATNQEELPNFNPYTGEKIIYDDFGDVKPNGEDTAPQNMKKKKRRSLFKSASAVTLFILSIVFACMTAFSDFFCLQVVLPLFTSKIDNGAVLLLMILIYITFGVIVLTCFGVCLGLHIATLIPSIAMASLNENKKHQTLFSVLSIIINALGIISIVACVILLIVRLGAA